MNTPAHGSHIARKEIPTACKWRTEDIYPSPEAWEKACRILQELIEKLTARQGLLTSPAALLETLRLRDRTAQGIEKIYAYARLQQDADNEDPAAQALAGKAESLNADYENAISFIEPEILALPREQRNALLTDPAFADYDFYLKNLERMSSHILPAREESLLARGSLAANSGAAAFRALVSADLTFPSARNSRGQDLPVSEGSYMLNITSPDRTLRENTFNALFGTYYRYRNTFSATLTGTCRSSLFQARARGYQDARDLYLSEENIPISLYDGLIDTIHAHLEPLHEYIALKKELLGYEELHYFDMYVPLSPRDDRAFSCSFAEACAIVQKALAPLGKQYGRALQKGMTEGWIDVYENRGKRSGAYSWGVFGVHPFVLLNYQPRYNSLSTLAHELGHSLHSYFSSRKQPYAKSGYTIFCAEVASTTNENLLLEYFLSTADKPQKIFLLNQYLETVRTTVYRQVQFAEFEKFIHGKVAAGEALQAETLENWWLESNRAYYGPSLTADGLLASEWSRIPHFYTPFYVYKYATGYSAATAFSESILAEAEGVGKSSAAVQKYLTFLASGGSDYSLNLLRHAGVDLNTPQPVEITLQKFSRKLKELKDLL